ncbi:YrbL family protein, partial [Klebsiella pneumoniae]|uniref:YrbL family protein n=1 Tax=Klebsiella pneumoniae TaxID=573 RepID=UPI002731D664
DAKGKMWSNLRLFRDGDGFAWIERRSVREPQLTELKKYAVFSKVQLLKQLKRYLQDNRIVTMSLKPQNILCHRISESEVIPVVCDNIGESTL